MDSPSKDIFNVLDEFIAAIEETKQVLQSPCVPGRTDACCLSDCERPRRKKPISHEHCECELLQSRLMTSEDELHRYGDNKYNQTVFITQHASQEKEAEGLVTEMNYLLNQIASAANSLKKIYNRRSSPVIDDVWRVSCFKMVFFFWSDFDLKIQFVGDGLFKSSAPKKDRWDSGGSCTGYGLDGKLSVASSCF